MSNFFPDIKHIAENHYQVLVAPGLCTPVDFLYGGSSLGIAIKVLELHTQRPVIWASAQFIAYAKPNDILDLFVEDVSRGRNISQMRVKACVGEKEIFSVSASLGSRKNATEGVWLEPPQVLAVKDCAEHKFPMPDFGNKDHIHKHQEYRLPFNDDLPKPEHKHIVWVRVKNADNGDASTLAVIADMATASGTYVLDKRVGGSSLDNTLRIVKRVPTEWVLFESEVQGICNGIATSTTRMWSEDKQLLAVASQSFIVREF